MSPGTWPVPVRLALFYAAIFAVIGVLLPFWPLWLAARGLGAAEIVDPRPSAVGSIEEAFKNYPRLTKVVPALGYYGDQLAELKATIEAAGAEVVIDASPADIDRLLDLEVPVARVRYRFQPVAGTSLEQLVRRSPF